MSFKATNPIGITARGIFAVMMLSSHVNSQQSDLACTPVRYTADPCPQYTDPPTMRNQQECENDGCYYCAGQSEECVEGPGCVIIDLTPDDECFDDEGFRILHRTPCRANGCSWCDQHPGFQCIKNPTSPNEMIIPPLSSSGNCDVDEALRVECDHLIPARKMFSSSCWLSGCHWCSNTGDPPCIQGKVCSTAKSTGEYDCRNDPSEVLSRHECLVRGCSWCSNNEAFKCVRDTPVGVSDLTCQRNVDDYFECPTYAGSPAVRNEQQCRDDGCYYCDSLVTKCVQGTGCSWINMITANECKTLSGNAISNRKVCRDEGCSWCEHHSGIKCFKNAATAEEVVSAPPPYTAACSSSPRVECPYLQPMYSGSPAQCWSSGCHWCPATTEPISCVQGEVCATQRSGEEYDCRDTPTESLSPYDCIQRGCSWCAANTAYECVRNLPDTPLAECPGLLHCFSSSILVGITEAQCNNQYRCSFCNSADLTKTCMRDTCPPGYVLRHDGESCCRNAITTSVDSPSIARIINGDVVPDDDFPWVVYYEYGLPGSPPFACGGFVVAPKVVITAAHCQARDDTGKIIGPGTGFIIAGVKDLWSPSRVIISVVEAIPHPFYSDILNVHDVMVLKLLNEVPSHVKPIQLPMGETPFEGTNCIIAGFGVTDATSVPPTGTTILLQATATLSSSTTCQNNLNIPFDNKFVLCAGGTGQSACFGDSGGALMCQRCSNCDWYAVGIASFVVSGSCSPAFPSFYAKVDTYQDFFEEHGVPIGSQTFNCDI